MQVNSTNRILRFRDRRAAKSSFLNSSERPSALATAVATPILSKSCMLRYSRSTVLFFHDLRRNAASFVLRRRSISTKLTTIEYQVSDSRKGTGWSRPFRPAFRSAQQRLQPLRSRLVNQQNHFKTRLFHQTL